MYIQAGTFLSEQQRPFVLSNWFVKSGWNFSNTNPFQYFPCLFKKKAQESTSGCIFFQNWKQFLGRRCHCCWWCVPLKKTFTKVPLLQCFLNSSKLQFKESFFFFKIFRFYVMANTLIFWQQLNLVTKTNTPWEKMMNLR